MSFLSSLGNALKSRTVWVGIGTVALGSTELIAQAAPYIAQFVPATTPVGAGITIGIGIAVAIARLRAKQPLGPVIGDTITKTVDAVHAIEEKPKPTASKVALVTSMVKDPKSFQSVGGPASKDFPGGFN